MSESSTLLIEREVTSLMLENEKSISDIVYETIKELPSILTESNIRQILEVDDETRFFEIPQDQVDARNNYLARQREKEKQKKERDEWLERNGCNNPQINEPEYDAVRRKCRLQKAKWIAEDKLAASKVRGSLITKDLTDAAIWTSEKLVKLYNFIITKIMPGLAERTKKLFRSLIIKRTIVKAAKTNDPPINGELDMDGIVKIFYPLAENLILRIFMTMAGADLIDLILGRTIGKLLPRGWFKKLKNFLRNKARENEVSRKFEEKVLEVTKKKLIPFIFNKYYSEDEIKRIYHSAKGDANLYLSDPNIDIGALQARGAQNSLEKVRSILDSLPPMNENKKRELQEQKVYNRWQLIAGVK